MAYGCDNLLLFLRFKFILSLSSIFVYFVRCDSHIAGMRERYDSNGGQLRLCAESKKDLSLTEASQWTLDNLLAVQPQVILPLLTYWSDFSKRLIAVDVIISAKCERSEHWRRLRDWSFCPSFRVCVCTWRLIIAMTSLHQQHKQQRWLLLFPPFPLAQSGFFLLPPLFLLYCVVVGVVVFVGVVVVIVMFKSLYLAEICTLTSVC